MRRFFVSRIVFGLVAGMGMWLTAASANADHGFTLGGDPAATLKGSVRFRQFSTAGGPEIRVGTPDGSEGIDVVDDANVSWGASPFTRDVSFSYSPVTGDLSGAVIGLGTAAGDVGALGTLNYLQITIVKNTPTTSISLNSIAVDGHALGSVSVSSGGATVIWHVSGLDLDAGFTLTGQVMVTGLSGGGDSNYVQIEVGSLPPSDTEGPLTSDVTVQPQPVILNGNATVTATVDDTTTGGNTIAAAHFQLEGGAINAMSAADGVFDEVSEDVEATFLATEVGTRSVCVYGTDSLNNVGDEMCQEFLVTYRFDGFFRPIENDVVNVAKASQAIPTKWRLTDADGAPIDDRASFVGLFSYPVDCDEFSGNLVDAVDEEAAGTSGLQWLEDGYWQFNWKTPKTYADTCRAMYVEFNSGATSPVVKFQFKK